MFKNKASLTLQKLLDYVYGGSVQVKYPSLSILLPLFILIGQINPSRAEGLPLNHEVTQNTIDQTICVPGYTKTVRPPASVTITVKFEMLRAGGYPASSIHDFILDHRIPLSLGGAAKNLRNFLLQSESESKDKDRIELCLAKTVCSGRISLAQAQTEIWKNWRNAGRICSLSNNY